MLRILTTVAGLIICCLSATDAPAAAPMPLVTIEGQSTSPLKTSLYYTQLQIRSAGFALSESDRKNLGKALLETLGLRKETRSIIVSLSISGNGITYPEVPLLAYQFDGSKRIVGVSRVDVRTLPLQRLLTNEQYSLNLSYKYSDQVAFDVNAATGNLTALFPGTTLATEASKPFLQGLGSIASAMLSLAHSQETNYRVSSEISPYAGKKNQLTIRLSKPDGSEFGTVTLTMLATPTLNREAGALESVAETDFLKVDGEDPASLAMSVGGSPRSLVTEIKGLGSYTPLAREKTDATVKTFCVDARKSLEETLRITAMDRVMVVYTALTDAGFAQTPNNSWYFSCFNEDDKAMLKRSLLLAPVLTVPPPPGQSAPLDAGLKYALGCLITGQQGKDCQKNASNPRQMLTEAFAAQVRIDIMEMPGVVDVAALPETRLLSRESLLDGLSAKAGHFGCFPRGLILTSKDDSQGFSVELDQSAGRLTSIRIRSVPASTINCF
jgi:hypothetical protein